MGTESDVYHTGVSGGGSVFLCPDCKQVLVELVEAYTCPTCKRSYQTVDNVLELLPKHLPEPSLEDMRAWCDLDSGRVEHQPAWLALLSKEAEIRQFQKIARQYFSPGRVLEIGGGLCWGSLVTKQMFPESYVLATDVAATALTKAREAAYMVGAVADRYIACDVHKLPFSDNSFDICFGSEVLHHLSDPVAGLKEVRRVLRPGGRYIGMGEGHASKPLRWLVKRFGLDRRGPETTKYRMLEELYPLSQWLRFFEEAGFSRVKSTICKDPSYQYRDRAKLFYYFLLSFLPDLVIRTAFGSSVIFQAAK